MPPKLYSTDIFTMSNKELLEAYEGYAVWITIMVIASVIGGICLYLLFVRKKNAYKGFAAKLHNFLSFKVFYIEAILKALYAILAIFITLFSLSLLSVPGYGFLYFLITFASGNILLRAVYELVMLVVAIARNTSNLNDNIAKLTDTKTTKKTIGSDSK